jgi:hypothetical protein
MGFAEHAFEQRGFARTQKAGEDGGGDQGHDRQRSKRHGKNNAATECIRHALAAPKRLALA